MENNRVQVRSAVNGTVVLSNTDLRFRREWSKKGQVNTIPLEILQDMIYEDGTLSLFKDGMLEIPDQETRIELGLEERGVEPEKHSLTNNQMLGALYGTPADIAKAINTLPNAQIDDFVSLAVEKEVTDMAKVDIIKKMTGKDVLALVKFNRQIKEPDKTEID